MAKFTLECPHCGALNTSPSSLKFWQKEINCGTCGQTINVKESRMISKHCPKCDAVVVVDQKKLKNAKCPTCGEPLMRAATTEYKYVDVICPQCNCQVEVNKALEYDNCPVCDHQIKVKEALSKQNLVKDGGISVIKYEGDNNTFVWKHPIEDFNIGSQLIVHESQEAIFFLNGAALDTFGPGRHSLETENLPYLKKIYDLPTNGVSPFHAEVYFVNLTTQMGLKWGTASRVRFIEPNTGIPLDIGASGEMNLQVKDSRKLLTKVVGTTSGLTRSQILDAQNGDTATNSGWSNALRGIFRPLIMTSVKTYLAGAIKTKNINILEIDERLDELSNELREKVSVAFEEYGLFVPQFYVTNVSLPEDNRDFQRLRNLRSASYLGTREAEVEADIVAAKRQAELERETTKTEMAKMQAERDLISAQTEAAKKRMSGLAEAEVMAAKGYTYKDEIEAEVQKAYAQGIGNMGSGSGSNGSGGNSMMSEMVGLGVSMAAMDTIGSKIGSAMKGFMPNNNSVETPVQNKNEDEWTCSCGAKNTGKFCPSCGIAKPSLWDCPSCGAKGNSGKFCAQCGAAEPKAWDCSCGKKGNTGKFCSECGAPQPSNDSWTCEFCGHEGNTGKFCSECGKKPDSKDMWDCECGNKGIIGKFCPECGKKREE